MNQEKWKHFFETNQALWNKRTKVHVESEFYDVNSFLQGKSSLNSPELEALGNIEGKSLLHLQCHFGMDTISLSRMGAITTGVDLSNDSIEFARNLALKTKTSAQFVHSNVLTLSDKLEGMFDIVFTSYGTIGWLPDIELWASQVAHFLKPGGIFLIVEFHPFLWTLDDDFKKFQYDYFNREVIEEDSDSTYTDGAIQTNKSFSWNHPLGEVWSVLSDKKLQMIDFQEFDYSCYNCFPNMEVSESGKFRFKEHGNKIPYMYLMKWKKPV